MFTALVLVCLSAVRGICDRCFSCTQATEVVSKLYAAHQAGDKNAGVDIEGDGAAVKDMAAAGVWDLYVAKWWGLKLSTTAANTVLRVDQVS